MKINFKLILKNIYLKYFGELKYIITLLGVDGSVEKYSVGTKKELGEIIFKVNDERYWIVQKVEKIRCFEFSTDLKIYHTPLFFYNPEISEYHEIKNHKYSFNKIDKSLLNVERCVSKPEIVSCSSKKYNDGKVANNSEV